MRQSIVRGCIVVLAVLVVAVIVVQRRYWEYLSGMWVGGPEFLTSAGLSSMHLYFAPGRRKHGGYVVMVDSVGKTVTNSAFKARVCFARAAANLLRTHDLARGRVTFDFSGTGGLSAGGAAGPFPAELRAEISMSDGTLTLRDNDRVYAFLYKDALASHVANAAYTEQLEPSE